MFGILGDVVRVSHAMEAGKVQVQMIGFLQG